MSESRDPRRPRRVAFVLAPQLHLLDLAGPAQVLSTAGGLGAPHELHYVAETEQVPTSQGVPVVAATAWPELTADDLIVVPGWRALAERDAHPGSPAPPARRRIGAGERAPALASPPPFSRATLDRLRAHHDAGGTVASVCSGADALGAAGLLDGRRFTTHHALADALARRYPQGTLVRDVLYVLDDRVVTSAGIASGIDLALHLVATDHGPELAARVARSLVVYTRRNGDEPQASALLRHRAHLSDIAHRTQDRIDRRFADRLALGELAAEAGVSERTLTRRFSSATGLTPLRYQQLLRLERAEHLIGHGATIETAAHAVGFSDARMLRRLRTR